MTQTALHEEPAHELEILFYVFGSSYIDTFLNYCLPSLLAGANREVLYSAHLSIWTRTHKEKMRLSAALDQHGLRYTIYRMLPFAELPRYTHIDFWLHRLKESQSKKLLFLIPDQLYANDALVQCSQGLDTHDCIMYKGLYVLKEAIPEELLRHPEVIDQAKIFDIFLHYAHPINLAWTSQTAISNLVYDNIIFVDENALVYQPINNHIQGINLEKLSTRKISTDFCNIYPDKGQTCLYIPNLAVNLDDILNQFNTVYPVRSITQKQHFVHDHLMHAQRPSRDYPEREARLFYDFRTQTLSLQKNPNFHRKTLLKCVDNPLIIHLYLKYFLSGDTYFTKALDMKMKDKIGKWPTERVSFRTDPENGTDFYEERRVVIGKFSLHDIAEAYLGQMQGLPPAFMDGTRAYLESMVRKDTCATAPEAA